MKSTVTVLFLCTFAFAKDFTSVTQDFSGRIVNGKEATLGQFPWVAALTLTKGNFGVMQCGGVLVHPQWVLSAAHCVVDAVSAEINLGILYKNETEVGLTVSAESAIIHENYSAINIMNDIALLKLSEEVTLTDNIQIIEIGEDHVEAGVNVTVCGWGQTDNYAFNDTNILLYTELVTISNEDCSKIYGDGILDEMVCCVGQDIEGTCYGDSGGPLSLGDGKDAKLVAIVSFGSDQGCMTRDPTGFTRTADYREWILANIKY